MTTLLYDGSFDGLLTAVFEVFEYKYNDVEIRNRERFQQENMFAEIHEVATQNEKSDRVLKKLETSIGKSGIKQLLMVFLSELPESEDLIFSVVSATMFRNSNLSPRWPFVMMAFITSVAERAAMKRFSLIFDRLPSSRVISIISASVSRYIL